MAAAATAGGYGNYARFAYGAGRWAGDAIKTFTGFGEYSINQNSLYEGAQAPFVSNASINGAVIISHREYIADIYTRPNGEFGVDNFVINPGLSSLFEYLAQIAPNFEQYVPMGIIFTFKSALVDQAVGANNSIGQVIMCTNYNVVEPNYGSKAEMEAAMYCMSCKPTENMYHPIECDLAQSPQDILYTRAGTIPSGTDPRLYDFANFQIATNGYPSVQPVNIGELWVSYEFALLKPRLFGSLGKQIDYFCRFGELPTYANVFGNTDVEVTPSSNITLGLDFFTNGCYITLPKYPMPVYYFFQITWVFSSSKSITNGAIQNFINCSQVVKYPGPYSASPQGGVSALRHSRSFVIFAFGYMKVTSFQFLFSDLLPNDGNTCTLVCTQIPQIL